MKRILIRKMLPSDAADSINVINLASLPHWKKENIPESTIKKIKAKTTIEILLNRAKAGHYFVAVDEYSGRIIGVIGLRIDDTTQILNRISTFYVLPEYQGKKIGGALFSKVKEKAIELRLNKLVVGSSKYAEPIYTHFGFKKTRVEKKKYPDGIKHQIIWLEMEI